MHILTKFLSIQYNMLLIYAALFSQSSINFVTGSNNCYRYLKNAVQYFFAEIYIVMVLICLQLVKIFIYTKVFHCQIYIKIFWYVDINFIFTEIQNTMQRDFLAHLTFNLLILFQSRFYYVFLSSLGSSIQPPLLTWLHNII